MQHGIGNPTQTETLIHRLRLMADAGGVLTRDRVKTIIESADRLEELNEKLYAMIERIDSSIDNTMFP